LRNGLFGPLLLGCPHESNGGLLHNPRHKFPLLQALANLSQRRFFRDFICLDVDKYIYRDDPCDKVILEKAMSVLGDLTADQRVAFVSAAEAILESERARRTKGDPKRKRTISRPRYSRWSSRVERLSLVSTPAGFPPETGCRRPICGEPSCGVTARVGSY
jgi:hypothetical protein